MSWYVLQSTTGLFLLTLFFLPIPGHARQHDGAAQGREAGADGHPLAVLALRPAEPQPGVEVPDAGRCCVTGSKVSTIKTINICKKKNNNTTLLHVVRMYRGHPRYVGVWAQQIRISKRLNEEAGRRKAFIRAVGILGTHNDGNKGAAFLLSTWPFPAAAAAAPPSHS